MNLYLQIFLRLRLHASVLLMLVSFCAALAFAWQGIATEQAGREKLAAALDLYPDTMEIKFLAADFNGWQTAYAFDIVLGTPNADKDHGTQRRRFLDAARALQQKLSTIKTALLTPDELTEVRKAQDTFEEFMRLDKEIIAAYRSAKPTDVRRANDLVLGREIEIYLAISASITRLTESVVARANRVAEESSAAANNSRWLFSASGAAALMLIVSSALLIRRVIVQQANSLAQVEVLAGTDSLTSLANRRTWDAELPQERERARRTGLPLSIVLIDLDHFKTFNDTRGHQAGDILLKELAKRCQSVLRQGDLIARYGGEEFGMLLPGCETASAAELVDQLRKNVPEGQTFSAGVASWDRIETVDALVVRADQALYEAKRAGRNCTVIAPATETEWNVENISPWNGQKNPKKPAAPVS